MLLALIGSTFLGCAVLASLDAWATDEPRRPRICIATLERPVDYDLAVGSVGVALLVAARHSRRFARSSASVTARTHYCVARRTSRTYQ